MKKKIAWGVSKLLKMYLERTKTKSFDYCIDEFSKDKDIVGIPIKKSEVLLKEKSNSFQIIIFAVSNSSLQEITAKLNRWRLLYGRDYIFYSDFFYKDFLCRAEKYLGFKLNPQIYRFALSFTMNSRVLIHTTILGTWLFLEILNKLNNIKGSIAEVGAFQGGNSLCSLNFMVKLNPKRFYIFDSFEGFPELSKNDPANFNKGDYNVKTSFHEIVDTFAFFPEARIVKGFVPATFNQIPKNEKFSLVFYDCDLYQPALDTFSFFWDKIVYGGYILIHDYETAPGGFTGVKKATHEFFNLKDVNIISFYECTMAVIRK